MVASLRPSEQIRSDRIGLRLYACSATCQYVPGFRRSFGVTYHSAGADLVLLKRLLNLLEVGQMTNVSSNALSRGAETSQGLGNVEVDLSCVGLGGDCIGGGEAGFLAENLVQAVDLGTVSVEDLHEGGLSASGTHGTSELQVVEGTGDVAEVHQQVLDPLGGALANGDGLSGLEVGEAQGGKVLVLEGELGEVVDDLGQLGQEEAQALLDKDQLGVVGDEAGGGSVVAGGRQARQGQASQYLCWVHVLGSRTYMMAAAAGASCA